ncbi:MAG: Spy/CpxP family protein refolding chaperone [Gallionellaceae bacterium]|nr:Spy/CpxP family protein refolding chaperone [Gallionellaceae bacterium]
MNKTVKMLLAGAAILAVSAGAYARGGDCGFGDGPMMGGMKSERMEKMREKHLETLHDKLKLTAQQETAWKKFAASTPMGGKMARPDPKEMEKLNAPQRMEKGLEQMRTMEKKMAEHLAVLKEFYAALTPEQQKTFDGQIPSHGDRGFRHGR